MNRAIISQRITSILAEIERLNNALYAMNTTDIQRYRAGAARNDGDIDLLRLPGRSLAGDLRAACDTAKH